ncbi:rRNA adenine N-6-methyltransferase family protein, partial [Gordonia sputi]|uniref:rRNA adenine N-6-methyltransferase family protein n=1 Tax=Gordonia sputi TaxID=36823 RepID=UPI002D1E3846
MAVLLVQAGSALSADSDSSSGGDGSPRLLGPAQIRQLAAEVGVRPTKTLGQNFVHDANTVRRIVAESGVGADDVVLEVGPGLGSLTLALLEQAGRVVAVEIDPVLAQRLPRTIAD